MVYTSRMTKALHKSKRAEVGIRELRAQLSRYVEAARKGTEVVVTDRGNPVARLSAYPEDDPLERLIAEGVATRGTLPKIPIDPKDLIKAKGSVSELLIEMREGRGY